MPDGSRTAFRRPFRYRANVGDVGRHVDVRRAPGGVAARAWRDPERCSVPSVLLPPLLGKRVHTSSQHLTVRGKKLHVRSVRCLLSMHIN